MISFQPLRHIFSSSDCGQKVLENEGMHVLLMMYKPKVEQFVWCVYHQILITCCSNKACKDISILPVHVVFWIYLKILHYDITNIKFVVIIRSCGRVSTGIFSRWSSHLYLLVLLVLVKNQSWTIGKIQGLVDVSS